MATCKMILVRLVLVTMLLFLPAGQILAAESKWVCDRATGKWLYGGFYEPEYDPATQDVYVFPDADPHPDPVLTRCDPVLKRRPATDAEQDEAKGERPEELRQSVGSVFAGTPAQKRARMADVVEKYPPLGVALHMLRGPLTPDARAFIAEILGRVKARIGTAQEVLTLNEYNAIKTLAQKKGLGALVP